MNQLYPIVRRQRRPLIEVEPVTVVIAPPTEKTVGPERTERVQPRLLLLPPPMEPVRAADLLPAVEPVKPAKKRK